MTVRLVRTVVLLEDGACHVFVYFARCDGSVRGDATGSGAVALTIGKDVPVIVLISWLWICLGDITPLAPTICDLTPPKRRIGMCGLRLVASCM